MARKQYYGIKFPCTVNDNENYYLDVNKTLKERARSTLMHVLFTPKKQRIRQPDFGTDLIKYIFENNDSSTWGGIKKEIQNTVKKYIPEITLTDLNVMQSETDEHEIYVRIDYNIQQGNSVITDSVVTQI